MSELISRLLPVSSSKSHSTPFCVLCLRPGLNDPNHMVVHPVGYPADVLPLYTIVLNSTKPNILIFLGNPDPANKIGDASFHSLSSTTDISLRGQRMRMTMNQITGNFTLESPAAGKLKWHVGKIIGRSLELRDSNGMKLAYLRSGGFPGTSEKKLEIFVPCEKLFIDLLVLSGIAAKTLTKDINAAAAEAVGAIAGA